MRYQCRPYRLSAKATNILSNALIFIGLVGLTASPQYAQAATYTVDTTADNTSLTACTAAPTDCSLRGAIANANSTIVDDTIDFIIPANDPGCTSTGICTITLINGLVSISSASTGGALNVRNATGAGNLLISGNDSSGIFSISGGNLTLSGVTVTRGSDSGISNWGTLTLLNSIVSGNWGSSAGGIFNNGSLIMTRSTVSGNTGSLGGGIVNAPGATALLTNSTVSGNTAGNGGGVYNNSMLGITSSLTLISSTITENAASIGTGYIGSGIFSASSSAVGGTFPASSRVIASNSIIAANSGGFDCAGVCVSNGYNLVGRAENGSFTGIGDHAGTVSSPINPMLGPLADNGGSTFTHALLPNSPAIDR